ncbi:MAG: FAD-dependent oxidoreductase [Planctomycetales bacterium]
MSPLQRFAVLLAILSCPLGGCGPETPPASSTSGTNQGPSEKRTALEGADRATDPSANSAAYDATDAIIVGAGISGLAAALELGRGGASVTVIDMSSVFGGHAVMSQGSLSIVGTPTQEAAGFHDTPDLAYDDFLRWGEDAQADWVRYYVDNSRREIYDWVTELGVRFEGVVSSPGNSVDREHQPAGRGISLVTPIYRACLEHSTIRFVWNTKVEQLLSEGGRVTGVVGRNQRSESETVYRAQGVILATGGFQSNLDMVRQFWPAEFRFPDRLLAGSGRNSVGFGHDLAQQVGGELARMDHQWNYFTGIPDPRYPGTNRGLNAANMHAILVNAQGQRFANLHGWAKVVMPALLQQPEATCWFIFDEQSKPNFVVSGSDWADFQKVEREILNNPALVHRADTLESLAEKAGLPSDNLLATVRRYNELVERGVDEDFHRFGPDQSAYSNSASPAINTPPYYAMQTFPLTRKSMGGVAIDRECRVVKADRQVIPGLYAVGELAGLAGINGKAALEGTFLGPCIVTGRVAARSILAGLTLAPAAPEQPGACASCHDIPDLVAQSRPGYWHFDLVHQVIDQRQIDCRRCHGELTPYRKGNHRINPQVLASACIDCHTARE